ncbi:hypothetical protein C8F01DRAFT_1286383 [Mycena amicta]|nr:hypothetical protein C8F01DRAFT_1286383 [Mycena amicta]
MRSFVSLTHIFALSLAIAGVFAGRIDLVERLASCRDAGTLKVLANATIVGGTQAQAAKYSATYCPSPAVEARTSAITELEERGSIEERQTCTQCPCANGSIQCFCHNLQFMDSLFIFSCSNSTPPSPFIPINQDCKTLAALVTGAPAGANLGFPVMTNGFYNVPVASILTWEFQGCGFAYFNDAGTNYNICAKDLANTIRALNGFCDDVNTSFGEFQNSGLKSCMTFNPAELG